MSKPRYRPADNVTEQRWEFIWWGFTKRSRSQRGFEADAPVHRSWRLGPAEIRIYLEAPKPPNHDSHSSEAPTRRLRSPEDMNR